MRESDERDVKQTILSSEKAVSAVDLFFILLLTSHFWMRMMTNDYSHGLAQLLVHIVTNPSPYLFSLFDYSA